MAKIAGNYQLVENKNFYQFLLDLDVPEDKAKELENRGTISVSVDGNEVTVAYEPPPSIQKYIIGQEVDENISENLILKSTATLDANVLKISSTKEGQPIRTRIFTFSDNGLELVFSIFKDGKTLTASRIYKRV